MGDGHHRDRDRVRQAVPVRSDRSVQQACGGLVHASPAGPADGDSCGGNGDLAATGPLVGDSAL